MKRRGRPATGHKPIVSVRMDPTVFKRALQRAKTDGKPVGQWLEEAIEERIDREVRDE